MENKLEDEIRKVIWWFDLFGLGGIENVEGGGLTFLDFFIR